MHYMAIHIIGDMEVYLSAATEIAVVGYMVSVN
jgi:hypothetical protein